MRWAALVGMNADLMSDYVEFIADRLLWPEQANITRKTHSIG